MKGEKVHNMDLYIILFCRCKLCERSLFFVVINKSVIL